MRALLHLIMILVLLSMPFSTVRAASWETLVMPGELTEAHAEYETECKRCHNRFDKQGQTRLCRDCHDKVDADMEQRQGFHGRHPDIAGQRCRSCHTEHQGRDADIVALNIEVFDHRLTDFALEGAHTGAACTGCHAEDRPYRDAPGACIDCHKDQDAHEGELGEACADCHTPQRWSETRFDHGETDFPLRGGHESLACNRCHLQQRYQDTPKACVACHRSNDVHRGRNGEACADCHNETRWDRSRFDHDHDTDFRLSGAHRDVACEACHLEPVEKKKPAVDCAGCHATDDEHQGRFGRACADCHTETRWDRVRFDHDRDTGYALRGLHGEVACLACHRGTLGKEEITQRCIDCHGADDVHAGQQGEQCERCHRETGWGDGIAFDHDLTRFPLIGLHATAPCEACHLSARFQDAPGRCIDCHGDEDPHKDTLGSDCALCHNPNAWSLWTFDHNEQTDFPLDGAHENLACEGCHVASLERHAGIARDCDGCHRQDDIHHGGFGRACDRCHTTESFSDVRLSR